MRSMPRPRNTKPESDDASGTIPNAFRTHLQRTSRSGRASAHARASARRDAVAVDEFLAHRTAHRARRRRLSAPAFSCPHGESPARGGTRTSRPLWVAVSRRAAPNCLRPRRPLEPADVLGSGVYARAGSRASVAITPDSSRSWCPQRCSGPDPTRCENALVLFVGRCRRATRLVTAVAPRHFCRRHLAPHVGLRSASRKQGLPRSVRRRTRISAVRGQTRRTVDHADMRARADADVRSHRRDGRERDERNERAGREAGAHARRAAYNPEAR